MPALRPAGRLLRRLTPAAALGLLAGPLLATWSIVAVNLATGEVAVASATCLTNFNLRQWLPVVIPEVGVGCAQASVDNNGNRVRMHDDLLLGLDPERILADLDAHDTSHQTRQYGIVDLRGRAQTFTGRYAFDWAGGVTGRVGDIVYAIQGNILTGAPVVLAAEQALRNTPGDLSQKVMAAMEAARSMGGDGRCSCSPSEPTGCGSPPPSFRKSAHVAFFIVARPGDDAGPCDQQKGCAQGDYWLNINLPNRREQGPEPVKEMWERYRQWRRDLLGRPDAMLSVVDASTDRVVAGAGTVVTVYLDLHDVEDAPLSRGGATVSVVHDARSAGLSSLRSVTDHNDGTYTLALDTGAEPGLDILRIVVDDGIRPVTLWPPLRLLHEAPPPAPYNDPEVVPGLDLGGGESEAFLLPDGLTAWFLSDQGGRGRRLLRATRPDPGSPFGTPAKVPLPGRAARRITDFWVSADELRLMFSAIDPELGVERLYRTARALPADPFDLPEPVVELDSRRGDGGPWLSPDERTLFFHSRRRGVAEIWRADRLSPEARWFEPVPVGLPAPAVRPLLAAGGTRILFHRVDPSGRLHLRYAEALPGGGFTDRGPLPGGIHPAAASLVASSLTPAEEELWLTATAGMDPVRARRTTGALQATPDVLSAAAGGRVDFTLDAGPSWGGAPYLLAAGSTGAAPGLRFRDAALPFAPDFATLWLFRRLGHPALAGFQGNLDAAGRAAASLDLPPGAHLPPVLVGRTWRFAFLATQGLHVWTSDVAQVELMP